MATTVYSYPGSLFTAIGLLTAQFTKADVSVPAGFKMGVENKTPEFLAKFPMGKVPAADTPEGPVSESFAIARYIARSAADMDLLGVTPYEQALVDQWSFFAATEILPNALPVWGTLAGFFRFNEGVLVSLDKLRRALKAAEAHLAAHGHFVSDKLSFADIAVFGAVRAAFAMMLGPDFRAEVPHLASFVADFAARPEAIAVYGEFAFAEKEVEFKQE
jgi:elongation factor 1-gamma